MEWNANGLLQYKDEQLVIYQKRRHVWIQKNYKIYQTVLRANTTRGDSFFIIRENIKQNHSNSNQKANTHSQCYILFTSFSKTMNKWINQGGAFNAKDT